MRKVVPPKNPAVLRTQESQMYSILSISSGVRMNYDLDMTARNFFQNSKVAPLFGGECPVQDFSLSSTQTALHHSFSLGRKFAT